MNLTRLRVRVFARKPSSRVVRCLWVLLLVLVPVVARAQTLTSIGLQCGGSAIPIDITQGATLGANDSRIQVLDRLYTYARTADEVCFGTKGKPYPGCQALASWK